MSSGERQWITKISKIFSVVFHPVFIPLYGLLLIYSSPTLLSFIPARMKWTIFLLVLANNVILPLSLAAILYLRGAIKTFNARDRNERVVLLTFALLMYTITAILLLKIQVPNLFRAIFYCNSICDTRHPDNYLRLPYISSRRRFRRIAFTVNLHDHAL